MMYTREDVLAGIRRVFSEREVSAVVAVLDGYGGQPEEPERERVQLAILRLSEGQQAKLNHYVQAAKRDYRDVLFGSESQRLPSSEAAIDVLHTHWAWALSGSARLIAQNHFGNLLVELIDRSVWRICPEDLSASKLAESAAELSVLWADDEFKADWTVENWVDAAKSKLGQLGEGQCYGFRVWPVLGGEYSAENMVVKSLVEWLAVSGDVGRQVKDLPPGTPIRLDTRDA